VWVSWKNEDEEVPKGTIGEVTGWHSDWRVWIQFSEGTWYSIPLDELTIVATPESSEGSARLEEDDSEVEKDDSDVEEQVGSESDEGEGSDCSEDSAVWRGRHRTLDEALLAERTHLAQFF